MVRFGVTNSLTHVAIVAYEAIHCKRIPTYSVWSLMYVDVYTFFVLESAGGAPGPFLMRQDF